MPDTFSEPELFEKYTIAGAISPGEITINGAAETQNWQVSEADGSSGGETSHKGTKIAKFGITHDLLRTHEIDEWSEFEAFTEVLRSSYSGSKAIGLDIYHPDLAALGITSVSVEKIGVRKHIGPGHCQVDVSFLEFKPPKPKSSTASSSKGNDGSGSGNGADGDDPNAAAKAELEALLAEAKQV